MQIMNEAQRLEIIKNASLSKANKKVSAEFEDLLEEILSEKLVVEHGLIEATDEDVKEEFESLDSHEDEDDEDFDNDENLVDMNHRSAFWAELES